MLISKESEFLIISAPKQTINMMIIMAKLAFFVFAAWV